MLGDSLLFFVIVVCQAHSLIIHDNLTDQTKLGHNELEFREVTFCKVKKGEPFFSVLRLSRSKCGRKRIEIRMRNQMSLALIAHVCLRRTMYNMAMLLFSGQYTDLP